MFRVKIISLLVLALAIFLSSCAPGTQYTLPPDLTLVPGTDVSQQVATFVSDALTRAALPPATSTPVPGAATLSSGNDVASASNPGTISSTQPLPSSGLKPADSATPAAGICGQAQGDPVTITLGIDSSGLPLAGRCLIVAPSQRIKLVNQSDNSINTNFAGYQIDLSVGGEMLLDRPVGQYLALGVHFLPMGPELWVKDDVVATAPPPIVEYGNSAVGYRLYLPGNWTITETNGSNKEVIFSPPNAEPFIAYLSVLLEPRTLEQIIQSYAQYHPDAIREDTLFYGYPAVKYTFAGGRNEYFIPYGIQLLLIATDRPNDGTVQSILITFRFMTPPQPVTYDATMADNGRTFVMNIGDKLRLNLDLSYGWSIISDFDPAVLVGAADGYFAFSSGTTTLTTTGNPGCLNLTPPCAMPSILYTITVVVR